MKENVSRAERLLRKRIENNSEEWKIVPDAEGKELSKMANWQTFIVIVIQNTWITNLSMVNIV